MIAAVRDARPPALLVGVLNPVNRRLLRSPLGRALPGLVLLEFRGRRTGRPHRVPVGWHRIGGTGVVVTPAPWRANFATGLPATLHHRGHARRVVGRLETDPGTVAAVLDELISGGTRPRLLGLVVPPGHTIRDVDVLAVDRAIIRFTPA